MQKMQKIKIIISIFMFCYIPVSIVCSSETRAQILEVVPDARSSGMGGVFTAIADDAGAVFFNPAGLASIYHTEVPFARNYLFKNVGNVFEGTQQLYAGYVYSLRDVAISNLNSPGTIAVTFNKINNGFLPERDVNGNFTGEFKAQDEVLTVAYGKTILNIQDSSIIMAGVGMKFYKEIIDDFEVKGEAYDVGILWRLPDINLSFGVSVRNMGTRVEYMDQKFDLPCKTVLGASKKILGDKLLVGADLSKLVDENFELNLGAELWFMNTIAFRCGYNPDIDPDRRITGGTGISLKQLDVFFFFVREISIDYACTTSKEFDGDLDTQQISINFKLGAD
jgi:hypothetical protein